MVIKKDDKLNAMVETIWLSLTDVKFLAKYNGCHTCRSPPGIKFKWGGCLKISRNQKSLCWLNIFNVDPCSLYCSVGVL